MRVINLIFTLYCAISYGQINCDSLPTLYSGYCFKKGESSVYYANYLNGLKHGKEQVFNKDGSKSFESNYQFGLLNDSTIDYYHNNLPKFISIYRHDTLIKTIAYYENGSLYHVMEMLGNIQCGWSTTYYSNGQIKTKRFYKEGIALEDFEAYYENGNLHYKAIYDEPTKTQNYCQYYENGQKEFCWVKLNEILVDDTFEMFYPSGQLKSRHISLKNKMYALIIRYNEQGFIIGREINNYDVIIRKRRFKFRMDKPFRLERK
jgi:antitoxin component YwqK of YwqJK toxin-antitoxin module